MIFFFFSSTPPLFATSKKLSTTTDFKESLVSWFVSAKWNMDQQHGSDSFSIAFIESN